MQLLHGAALGPSASYLPFPLSLFFYRVIPPSAVTCTCLEVKISSACDAREAWPLVSLD